MPESVIPTMKAYSCFQQYFNFQHVLSSDISQAIAKGSVLGNPDLQLWTKQQVHSLIGELMALCNHSDTTPIQGSTDELAIDRFSQICQIAIATRILSCTRGNLSSYVCRLKKP